MAQFTTSNLTNQFVGRELSIASSFVKQYYTILNKAPCFIHNFYSHDSTFIHGTIEMAHDSHSEPIVGREKIKKKMEDLRLNDCRAKIKQIDCLETLAGGLVIQVIGELSNNGRPMRRFLQTFVLAQSPDESRSNETESQTKLGGGDGRRQQDSSPSQNQKFFVLNSIFRYQDDLIENEEIQVSIQSNVPAETRAPVTNPLRYQETRPPISQQQHGGGIVPSESHEQILNQPNLVLKNSASLVTSSSKSANDNSSVPSSTTNTSEYNQNRMRKQPEARTVEEIERLSNEVEDKVKVTITDKPSNDEFNRESKPNTSMVTPGNIDKKAGQLSEEITENAKPLLTERDRQRPHGTYQSSSRLNQNPQQQAPVAIEVAVGSNAAPKTWANMVRNAHASPATPSRQQMSNVTKGTPTEQPQPQPQSQPQSQPQLQLQPHQEQQSLPQTQQPLASPNQVTNQQQYQQQSQNQQGAQNQNRRRHIMRKPSNKSAERGGERRPMNKNRPPRPPIQQPPQGSHHHHSPSGSQQGSGTKPSA